MSENPTIYAKCAKCRNEMRPITRCTMTLICPTCHAQRKKKGYYEKGAAAEPKVPAEGTFGAHT